MKRYTAAVVGGGSGGKLSLNALRASDRYELVALSDISPEALEACRKKFPDLRTFASHEEMFRERPTDVVCVATWPPSHREITLAALALPLRGILVEKPLADTAGDGLALFEAIREKNLPLAVPHGLLTDNHVREIIARVHNGEIGELRLVEIENSRWDIINAGIHWLTFFVTLVRNEPVEWVLAACDASTRTWRDGMQVETLAVTYAQTRSGVRVVMQTGDEVRIVPSASLRTGPPEKGTLFRLIGTRGMIECWGR